MADVKALGDQLVELTVKEVTELASYLKETYGIEPAAAVAVAGPAAGGDAAGAEPHYGEEPRALGAGLFDRREHRAAGVRGGRNL